MFQTKGHGLISNIADKEQKTYKGYNFLIDHEKKTTTITLKSVNINEFTKAKENGTEMIPYRETYEYQGTNLYDIAKIYLKRRKVKFFAFIPAMNYRGFTQKILN